MLNYYYPRTTRAITIALIDLFNNTRVVKYDSDNNPISEKIVPVTFGPVEKYHQDRTEDHYFDSENKEHNKRYYLQIPRISVVLNGIAYDPDRATGVNEWRYWFKESLGLTETQLDSVISDYQPTPYNYNFGIHIKNDSMDYLSQILENILPYFNPSLMLRVKEFSFLNVERDLPTILDGVNPEFVDDQTANDSRFINASMNLTVRGFMYRPVVYSKIIKFINSDYIHKSVGASLDGYSTSGFDTSADAPSEFWTRGSNEDGKDFDWYKNYNGFKL